MAKRNLDYYCVAVRRNYEATWRFIGKYATQEQAQAALEDKRGYKGHLNYDNADLRVVSRAEAKQELGAKWEYAPIGEKPAAPKPKPSKKAVTA